MSSLQKVSQLLDTHLRKPKRRPNTAIAAAAGVFLWDACEQREVTRVLDLGSGFSTWVLRAWAAECGREVECVTVDHLEGWLRRTQAEVTEMGWDSSEFYTWEQFLDLVYPDRYFDFIFVDINGGAMRYKEFANYEYLTDYMVCDDFQFDHIRESWTARCVQAGFTVVERESETKDQYGRWMAEAYRG